MWIVPLAVGALLGWLLRLVVQSRFKTLLALLALLPPAAAATEAALTTPATDVTAVVTEETIDAPPALVWRNLVFYEETSADVPWILRIGLPRPVAAAVTPGGDEETCVYTTGYARKRIVERTVARRLGFVVTEQALGFEHDVRLIGGSFDLLPDGKGGTLLRLTTRYIGVPQPDFAWRTAESWALTALHQHVIANVRARCAAEIVVGVRR